MSLRRGHRVDLYGHYHRRSGLTDGGKTEKEPQHAAPGPAQNYGFELACHCAGRTAARAMLICKGPVLQKGAEIAAGREGSPAFPNHMEANLEDGVMDARLFSAYNHTGR